MDSLKAVIVDDEEPGRDVLHEYLKSHNHISVAASFAAPSKAVEFINNNEVHLLFLDIQMPVMNGFEMLSKLENLPQVIFSTAYDEFALRAFEVNAVDYLLKPYTRKRFDEALQRVIQKKESKQQELQRIQALISSYQQPAEYPERLFIRVGVKIIPIQVNEIIWVKAEGDYSRIFTQEDSFLCSTGLGDLETKLNPKLFQRAHRSYLIAINKLNNLISNGGGGFIAKMADGSEVKVSRSHAEQIKKLII